MTVRELINALEQYPPDFEVFHMDGDFNGSYSRIGVEVQRVGTLGREQGVYIT